ncbi:MAG: caspase family protein [Desulfobacterales bacterium]|jgi:hypothetical protein
MMKSTLFRLVGIACFMLLLTPSDSESVQKRRIALVIGNGAYKSSPLANPINDATDMATALKKLGFSVRLKINANQRSMENSIRAFGKELRSGGVGLFYYAGHGIQVHGRNYLIPIVADIESEADVKYESVDAGRVLSQMNEAENGLNIIILDACRDNPYARSFRSSEKGLAKMDAPTGSILAYATAPGSVAADGSGRNGLYTSMLLKHMMTPDFKIEDVFKQVRKDVVNTSNNKQVPWESSSLMGDFYFYPKRGIAVKKQSKVESKKPIKETPKYASISPEISEPKIVDRDNSFIKYANGVVYDKNTGLEWFAGPDKNTSWKQAKIWVENLEFAGGGWRMPTKNELQTLYQKGAGTRNMTSLLKTTGWFIWSIETKGSSSAWLFGFKLGHGFELWPFRFSAKSRRVFAVRSKK